MPSPMRAPERSPFRSRWMSYSLEFLPSATKEWHKLGAVIQVQFKKKLAERLKNPHVPASRLRGSTDRYKIKLRQSRYRLIYDVRDVEMVVTVIAVGKRSRGDVYNQANRR